MIEHIYIVPRWGGRPQDEWYVWLAAELQGRLDHTDIHILDMPNPDQPTIESWPAALKAAVGTNPDMLENTLLIGHSVGCQTILRYLAELPDGVQVHGLLLVAAWWHVDDPSEAMWPWLSAPFDIERAREAAGEVAVIISENDPFTADYVQNKRLWEERMGANVTLTKRGGHFSKSVEPNVLDAFVEAFIDA